MSALATVEPAAAARIVEAMRCLESDALETRAEADGHFAAAFAAACTNPIDVIKTRMQIAGANTEVFAYSGPADCLKQLIRKEGVRALFAGIGGRFLYTGPAFAIFFPTYDLLKTAYVAL